MKKAATDPVKKLNSVNVLSEAGERGGGVGWKVAIINIYKPKPIQTRESGNKNEQILHTGCNFLSCFLDLFSF